MKKIYLPIQTLSPPPPPPPPPPLPHSFGPGTFALNCHTYNPLVEKIVHPPLTYQMDLNKQINNFQLCLKKWSTGYLPIEEVIENEKPPLIKEREERNKERGEKSNKLKYHLCHHSGNPQHTYRTRLWLRVFCCRWVLSTFSSYPTNSNRWANLYHHRKVIAFTSRENR